MFHLTLPSAIFIKFMRRFTLILLVQYLNIFGFKFKYFHLLYLVLFLCFLSCDKQVGLETEKIDNKKYYHKYKDEELGYFKGNITPIIGGDMRNLLGSVKIYSEDLRSTNPTKDYRVVFNAISYGEYYKNFTEQKITMEMNLTDIKIHKEYSVILNKDDFRNPGNNWIYTFLHFTNTNNADTKQLTYIPNQKPVHIVITKINKDPYYQIPIVEGYVNGELYNTKDKNDILKLNFEFKSRYYENFERQ